MEVATIREPNTASQIFRTKWKCEGLVFVVQLLLEAHDGNYSKNNNVGFGQQALEK